MHLPREVSDRASKTGQTKSPEVVNIIGNAGTALEEFDLIDSGNHIHSYVKVKVGDKITLNYAIPKVEDQILDICVDGVLRESHFAAASDKTHQKGRITRVCACEVRPSGAKGKLEYSDMVIEEKKTSADISPSALESNNLKPSGVGSIEVRVLRKMSFATNLQKDVKLEQAIRGPTFEDTLRWWNVSRRIDSSIIAPTYQIGFVNGRKTYGGSRKNVGRSIDGFYLWASFEFFYRSASDIQAAGLKIGNSPSKSPSDNTSSRRGHLKGSIESTKSAPMAAITEKEISSVSLETSTKFLVHQEYSGLTSITAGEDKKERSTTKSQRPSQPDYEINNGENEKKRIEDSSRLKIENKSLKPNRLEEHETLKGALIPGYGQSTTLNLEQDSVVDANNPGPVLENGNHNNMSMFVSKHETSQHGLGTGRILDHMESEVSATTPDLTTTSSVLLTTSIPGGSDVNKDIENYGEGNMAPLKDTSITKRADTNSLMRANAGHYMSQSPQVDKEIESLESQAKSMTNGKGDWRNRAVKMLEVISAPIKDHMLDHSSQAGLARNAVPTQDVCDESLTKPFSNSPKKRTFDQSSFASSSPCTGDKSPFNSQLEQGISPKQRREEHARKKTAKRQALENAKEVAARIRRQVEEFEAQQAAQQELELQDLDAETQMFQAEAEAWKARLRELSDE